MNSVQIYTVLVGIVLSIGLGILSNWLYDILVSRNILPSNLTSKRILIVILTCVPLAIVVTLLTPSVADNDGMEEISTPSATQVSNCSFSASEISASKSVVEAGEEVELSVTINNPKSEVVLLSWEALYGTVSPSGRSSSAYSIYTAPTNSVDDIVTIVITSPNCNQLSLSRQISITPPSPRPEESLNETSAVSTSITNSADLFIQFGERPVKPLLNSWVAPMSPECTYSAEFYYTDQIDLTQPFPPSVGPKVSGLPLPWTPAVLYFSIQSDVDDAEGKVNITDIIVTQEYRSLDRDFVGYQSHPICAGEVIGSIFGFSSAAQSLGLIKLVPEKEQYQILDLDLAESSLVLESSEIANFYLFLSGGKPGIYLISIDIRYQSKDSGVLETTSDFIEVLILGTDRFSGWYTEDFDSFQDGQYSLGKVTGESPADNLWRLSDYYGVDLKNLVTSADGEYIVLENTTENPISLSSLWGLHSCDGRKLITLNPSWNDPITLLPNDVARFGTSQSNTISLESYYTLPETFEGFGRCVLLTFDDVPLAQYPRR